MFEAGGGEIWLETSGVTVVEYCANGKRLSKVDFQSVLDQLSNPGAQLLDGPAGISLGHGTVDRICHGRLVSEVERAEKITIWKDDDEIVASELN